MKLDGENLPNIDEAEFVEASGFRVRVGTNGYQGGDAGHGSRTYFQLDDMGGSELAIDLGREGRSVTIKLGGDSELSTFIQALEFAVRTLKSQSRERQNAGVTVGELREQLEGYSEDAELYMGGLQFYRLKRRGEKLVQLEFNQQVYRDEDGEIVVEEVD